MEQHPSFTGWQLKKIKFLLEERIGEGEFGNVFRGTFSIDNHLSSKTVAIKASKNNSKYYKNETFFLRRINHPSIIQFIGFTPEPNKIMFIEFMPHGSVLSFIQKCPNSIREEQELFIWAAQVACGMKYLGSKKIVHRDLAARNVLLESTTRAKIADFGLARHVGEDNLFKENSGGLFNWKW